MKLKYVVVPIMLCTGMVSCSDETHTDIPTTNDTDTVAVETEVEVEAPEFVPPSPVHIAMMFKRAGLNYVEGIMHDPNARGNYATDDAKLFNMGIYSADMAYMVVNEETQNSMEHMKAIRHLSEELNLNSMFNSENVIDRFEKNLANKDSMFNILNDIQARLDDYVDDNDESEMRLMVFTGAWVQSMHLGGQSVLTEGSDGPLNATLAQQMDLLGSMLRSLNAIESPIAMVADVRQGLQEAYDQFLKYEGVEIIDGEVDYENIQLSTEDLSALAQKMQSVRDRITAG